LGWKDALERAKFHIDASKLFGKMIEWIVFIVFLMIAFDVAGINYVATLLTKVVGYLPNIIIASLVFIGAIFLSDFSYRIVIVSTGEKVSYSKVIGGILRTFIWIFAILTILLQLGIAPDIIRAIVYGLIFMVALAGGLAFGLGGKDLVAQLLKNIKDKLS
jgi:small-conductance mechanosensitive channel